MDDPLKSRFTLTELNRRLTDSRARIFGSKDSTWVGTTAAIVMALCIVIIGVLGFALPTEKRWIGLIPTLIELAAWPALVWDQRRVKLRSELSGKDSWLDQYDRLAEDDDKTISWLTSFGKEPIERAIETIQERALGEAMATSMVFGASGKIGLLVVLGVIYTQVTSFIAADQSFGMTFVRTTLVAVIAGVYAASWPVLRDQVKRDRMLMILEFSRKRLENVAAAPVD